MIIYDFAAIGVGPFNLSLACLTEGIADLDGLFLDEKPSFDWHTGLLIPCARMQTPFMADLVTPADPTSRFSFLNYLKDQGRLQQFLIRGDIYPLRQDFNEYCNWCSQRLPHIRFGERVDAVSWDGAMEAYRIRSTDRSGNGREYHARKLVVGTGSRPDWPPGIRADSTDVLHSSDYMPHRAELAGAGAVTVVGGGQSGAEIVLDLLLNGAGDVTWLTRAGHFFPTEDTKFALEVSTPAYSDWFQGLPAAEKQRLLDGQNALHKGARLETLEAIYDVLYASRIAGHRNMTLRPDSTLQSIARERSGRIVMELVHGQSDRRFHLPTDKLVLATGYRQHMPGALDGIADHIRRDEAGQVVVARNYSIDHQGDGIFMHNNDLQSHGVSVFDLGMVCYRNTVIINALAGREVYAPDRRPTFQQFAPPDSGFDRESNHLQPGG